MHQLLIRLGLICISFLMGCDVFSPCIKKLTLKHTYVPIYAGELIYGCPLRISFLILRLKILMGYDVFSPYTKTHILHLHPPQYMQVILSPYSRTLSVLCLFICIHRHFSLIRSSWLPQAVRLSFQRARRMRLLTSGRQHEDCHQVNHDGVGDGD